MKGQRRSATVTLLAFAGFGLVCGLVSAAVLWWYASQPFTIYTFSYRPHDLESTQIEKVSVYRFITGLLIGGPIFGNCRRGARFDDRVNLVRREHTIRID